MEYGQFTALVYRHDEASEANCAKHYRRRLEYFYSLYLIFLKYETECIVPYLNFQIPFDPLL